MVLKRTVKEKVGGQKRICTNARVSLYRRLGKRSIFRRETVGKRGGLKIKVGCAFTDSQGLDWGADW